MLGPAGQGQRKPTSPLSPEAVGRQERLIRQEAQQEVVEAGQRSRGLLLDPEDRPLQGESGRDWGLGGGWDQDHSTPSPGYGSGKSS